MPSFFELRREARCKAISTLTKCGAGGVSVEVDEKSFRKRMKGLKIDEAASWMHLEKTLPPMLGNFFEQLRNAQFVWLKALRSFLKKIVIRGFKNQGRTPLWDAKPGVMYVFVALSDWDGSVLRPVSFDLEHDPLFSTSVIEYTLLLQLERKLQTAWQRRDQLRVRIDISSFEKPLERKAKQHAQQRLLRQQQLERLTSKSGGDDTLNNSNTDSHGGHEDIDAHMEAQQLEAQQALKNAAAAAAAAAGGGGGEETGQDSVILPDLPEEPDFRDVDIVKAQRSLTFVQDKLLTRIVDVLILMFEHEWDEDLKAVYTYIPKTAIIFRYGEKSRVFVDQDYNLVFQGLFQDITDDLALAQKIRLTLVEKFQLNGKLLHVLAMQDTVYKHGNVDRIIQVVNDEEMGYWTPDAAMLEDVAVDACKSALQPHEVFVKCWHLAKINRKGMEQERMLVLTRDSLITMRFDFRSRKIDPNAGKTHSLDAFLLVEIGPFEDKVDAVAGIAASNAANQAAGSSSDGSSHSLASDVTHASTRRGEHTMGMSIYFSKTTKAKKNKQNTATFDGVLRRYHPSTEGMYENLFISWDRAADPSQLFQEVAWTVYAVAQSRRRTGSPGCFPYYPYVLIRPKPTKSALIYNKTRKGYSSAKLRRARKRSQGGTGSEGENDDSQTFLTFSPDALSIAPSDSEADLSVDENDED
eukprot:ANDGO_03732.mRNA.1 hypothetical protein